MSCYSNSFVGYRLFSRASEASKAFYILSISGLLQATQLGRRHGYRAVDDNSGQSASSTQMWLKVCF